MELLCSSVLHAGAQQPSHNNEDNEDLDCAEAATIAPIERRAVLQNYLPEDEDPLSVGLGRWEAVGLRRIRTETAITPLVLARFNRNSVKTMPGISTTEAARGAVLASHLHAPALGLSRTASL